MKASFLRSPWGPLALAILWLTFTAWARTLTLPDEGRYVGVAWGMLASGDWLTPHLNGLPYFHKPPLFYWITATSIAAFGPTEWAARLASLVGAAAGATAIYLFARRWYGEREARMALLALVTQPLFFIGAQFANLDMLVAGCIGATILAFAHASLLQASGRPAGAALAAGYLLAALGVLAKGLIGIVLPGMVLVAWLLLQRRPRAILALLWLPGLALFLAVAGPWFVLMQMRFPEFAHYFIVVQHFSRFAQGGFNNQQPVWFFLVVLAVLALPWSAWLARAAGRGTWADPARGALRQLLWIWLAAILLFFSIPQSKLVGYILPATLPLALLAADGLARAGDSLRAARWWCASAVLAVAVCLVAAGAAAMRTQPSSRDLGTALRAGMKSGDRVVFLEGYYFDLPFYGRLRAPAVVVDDWNDPKLTARDNWRKEVADAGHFDAAEARRLLITPAELPERYCDGATTWVVGSPKIAQRYPLLRGAPVVAVHGESVLWRVAAVPPGVTPGSCPEKPSVSSAGKS
ncbi:MAG: glycosyl transferase [Ramlibacter sp.]|nr:glycosyl transferase [Ramlibacter sp.]